MRACRRAWRSASPSAGNAANRLSERLIGCRPGKARPPGSMTLARLARRLRLVKILILKPSSLGDVVQALPVLRLIKRHLPASEIYWWIDSNLAPLLEGDPDLAGVVRFERRRWAAPRHWGEIWRSVRWLRQQGFDWVIDLQCLMRSGVFAWLANGKLSIGLDEPREGARGFYDLIVRRPSALTHAVDWYLSVLPHLGRAGGWGFPMAAASAPRWPNRCGGKWPVDEARWMVHSARRALAEQALAGRILCRAGAAAGGGEPRIPFRHSRRRGGSPAGRSHRPG